MKKRIFIVLSLVLIAILTVGCNAQSEADLAATEEAEHGENAGTGAGLQIQSTNLMMATFQLENTEHAITAEQAEELLPLWKVYQNLINSDTAAEAEREALINQIAGVMTEEQMAYLESDEIDPAQTQALMKELGIEMQGGMGGDRPGADGEGEGFTDAQREEMQAMRETMGGEDGGSGGGMGMRQDMDPDQLATMQAERAAEGGGVRGGGQMDEYLLPALIELLESKL